MFKKSAVLTLLILTIQNLKAQDSDFVNWWILNNFSRDQLNIMAFVNF